MRRRLSPLVRRRRWTGAGSVPGGGGSSVTVPVATAFRSQQPHLFTDVLPDTPVQLGGESKGYTPARASVADPKQTFGWGDHGPTWTHVDKATIWAWANAGGDWVNVAGTPQATTQPHFSFTANAVTSGVAAYTTDITAGAQAAFARGRWMSFIVRASGGTRTIASQVNATQPRPSIAVTYTDGSQQVLGCTACARLVSGTSYSQIAMENAICGVVAMEFQMPTKAVQSATLSLTLTVHSATASTINGYLANPPVNAEPVTTGLAASYPGDVGVTGHAAVLFAQRHVDGTALSDYILPVANTPNIFAKSAWDPELWGGAADPTKLPTAALGLPVAGTNKWIWKSQGTEAIAQGRVQVVPSTYSADGFVPVEPGVGALRINIPATTLEDGAVAGFAGGSGADLWALFPKAISGIADEVFVRFKVRFSQAPKRLADMKMLRTSSGSTAVFATQGSKWGIGPHHWTTFGGNNNVGGDNLGWSNRMLFTGIPGDAPLSGWRLGIHSWDNIGRDLMFGGGGLGAGFYPGRWYDIEVRLKLNTWNSDGSPSPSDAVCQVWIDGRLDCTHTNFKYRDGALAANYLTTPNFAPFREMGAIGLCLNHYNGGVLPADQDFTTFYSHIVCGTLRIGPVADGVPAWASALVDGQWVEL